VQACFAGILPEGRAEELIRAIEALHEAPGVAALTALLRPA